MKAITLFGTRSFSPRTWAPQTSVPEIETDTSCFNNKDSDVDADITLTDNEIENQSARQGHTDEAHRRRLA
jgi:hypothetical protein